MPWDRRLDLHLDVDAPAGRVLLTSATDSSLLNARPDLVHGDKFTLRLHFWARGATAGSLAAADPGATSILRCSGRPLGVPAASDLLFLADAFSQVSEGIWEAVLDLATAELADHLAATPEGSKEISVEVEVSNAGETERRSLQFTATARPQVYDNQDAPTALPAPLDWLAANGIRYLPDVTALTGGGATALDGLATVDLPAGHLVAVLVGTLHLYRLTGSAAAENSPTLIRPDDYDAPDNQKLWVLTSLTLNGLFAEEAYIPSVGYDSCAAGLVTALAGSGTISWDVRTHGNHCTTTLTAPATLSPPDITTMEVGAAATLILRVTQDGTGGHTLALGTGITLLGGGTIATGAGDVSILTLVTFDYGTTWHATIAS